MLQVARLAPKQLGESRDLVAAFLRAHTNPDGGFQDRAGASDLYYTVFGLDALIALQEDAARRGNGRATCDACDPASLDFVHAACLARAWAAIRRSSTSGCHPAGLGPYRERVAAPMADTRPRRERFTAAAYAAFLALGAYQDFGRTLPAPEQVLTSIRRLRAADGGYANQPGLTSGITPATAAADHGDASSRRAA